MLSRTSVLPVVFTRLFVPSSSWIVRSFTDGNDTPPRRPRFYAHRKHNPINGDPGNDEWIEAFGKASLAEVDLSQEAQEEDETYREFEARAHLLVCEVEKRILAKYGRIDADIMKKVHIAQQKAVKELWIKDYVMPLQKIGTKVLGDDRSVLPKPVENLFHDMLMRQNDPNKAELQSLSDRVLTAFLDEVALERAAGDADLLEFNQRLHKDAKDAFAEAFGRFTDDITHYMTEENVTMALEEAMRIVKEKRVVHEAWLRDRLEERKGEAPPSHRAESVFRSLIRKVGEEKAGAIVAGLMKEDTRAHRNPDILKGIDMEKMRGILEKALSAHESDTLQTYEEELDTTLGDDVSVDRVEEAMPHEPSLKRRVDRLFEKWSARGVIPKESKQVLQSRPRTTPVPVREAPVVDETKERLGRMSDSEFMRYQDMQRRIHVPGSDYNPLLEEIYGSFEDVSDSNGESPFLDEAGEAVEADFQAKSRQRWSKRRYKKK